MRRTFLILAVLLILVGSVTVEFAVLRLPHPLHIGVNYLTTYNGYATPGARLENDFARFESNGLNTIVIPLYWYRVESSQGVYDETFIDNVIHIIQIANTYHLSVMIDFHTLIGDSDAWSNPSYVGVGMNLITQPQIAAAYVAMVTWTVGRLKGLPNIWAYSVVNEPWYWPLDSWRKTSWINLIAQLTQSVRTLDNKLVTVRFVGALFDRDWAWDPKLIGSLDFISINAFLCDTCTNSLYWTTFGEYKVKLNAIAQNASTYRKSVQITEFGYSTPNDTLQASIYAQYLSAFKQIPNLSGWLGWGWDSSYDPNNPSWTAIGTYAIDTPTSDTPRPAYLVLIHSTG